MTTTGRMVGKHSPEEAILGRFVSNVRVAFGLLLRPPRSADRRPAWPPQGTLALSALISILVLIAVVMLLDAVSIRGAKLLPPDVVWVFEYITRLGLSGWFLYPIGITLAALALADFSKLPDFSRRMITTIACRLGFVFLAIGVPGLFVAIVKRLIGRARPGFSGDETWAQMLFVWRAEYASFPSGHATTAFAAAIAIGAIWRAARPVMWVYAVLIAVSRVVVLAHHPSDVVAGAIVGTVGALMVRNWYATRRLGFTILADGTVRPLPGPSWRRIKAVARRTFSA